VWKTFWAAQQRFFKLLCIDLKLDSVLQEVCACACVHACAVGTYACDRT
jgi:hypothetical protein